MANDLVTGCISFKPTKLLELWLPENSIVYHLDKGCPLLLLKLAIEAVILVLVTLPKPVTLCKSWEPADSLIWDREWERSPHTGRSTAPILAEVILAVVILVETKVNEEAQFMDISYID